MAPFRSSAVLPLYHARKRQRTRSWSLWSKGILALIVIGSTMYLTSYFFIQDVQDKLDGIDGSRKGSGLYQKGRSLDQDEEEVKTRQGPQLSSKEAQFLHRVARDREELENRQKQDEGGVAFQDYARREGVTTEEQGVERREDGGQESGGSSSDDKRRKEPWIPNEQGAQGAERRVDEQMPSETTSASHAIPVKSTGTIESGLQGTAGAAGDGHGSGAGGNEGAQGDQGGGGPQGKLAVHEAGDEGRSVAEVAQQPLSDQIHAPQRQRDKKQELGLYGLSAADIEGVDRPLSEFAGKVSLVVNVASFCGYTDSNYKGLQKLYEKYHPAGLEILAFPCNQFGQQEPRGEADIQAFCSDRYGVSFPIFSKVDVNGPNKHPVYEFLKSQVAADNPGWAAPGQELPIAWNFVKFLVNKQGRPVKMFPSTWDGVALEREIYMLLLE